MTVHRKTLVIIAVTCFVLMAVLYGVARAVILGNAREAEQLSGNLNMRRMLNILDERVSSLDRFNLDHSSLDGTYEFVTHPNRQMDLTLFGENNQTNPAARRFGFLILLDSSGRDVAERKFYLRDGKSREIPESLRLQLAPGNILLQHSDLTQSTRGVVMVPEGPLLVVSRAVLKTDGSGPSRGTLLAGRFFDAYDLEPMEKLAGFELTVQRLDRPDLLVDTREALSHLSAGGATYFQPVNDANAWEYMRIDDVEGKPALILRADIPRRFYRNGITSQYYFLVSIIVAGIVFCVVIQLLLERTVVTPISKLNRSVGLIAAEIDVSARLKSSGKDELSSLASSINHMLDSLQVSQEQNRQAEERHRAFMNHIPAIASITDQEGRYVYVNQPLSDTFNLRSEDLLGKTIADWMPEAAASNSEHDREVLACGGTMQFDDVLRNPDGKVRYWLSFKFLLNAPDGRKLIGTVAIDITARKEWEVQVQEARRKPRRPTGPRASSWPT